MPKWVEAMVVNRKILEAVKNSITHLENSIAALGRSDQRAFEDCIWHAAAELEYAVFLFSVTFPSESDRSRWRPNIPLKKADTLSVLCHVKALLKEAERSLSNAKTLESYKNAYIARQYLAEVQEDLARKERKSVRGK
jgi:hypothetical protein